MCMFANTCDTKHVTFTCVCASIDKLNVEMSFSKSKREKSKHLADEKLRELYPLTVGKELFSYVQAPVLGGSYVSSTTAKFAANYSCVSEVEVIFSTFVSYT